MNEAEFVELLSKMEEFYDKEYNNEQRKIIYANFKNGSKERFTRVINHAYRKCKFLPKLADLIEIADELPKLEKKEETQKAKCDKCKGTGMIVYTKLVYDFPYTFVAKCECNNGQALGKSMPSASQIGVLK